MTKIDMALYKEIGKILKTTRINAGISLDQLVGKLNGVKTKSTLKRYEDGNSRLDMDMLQTICNALNIDYISVVKKAEEKAKYIYDDSPLGDYEANMEHLKAEPKLLALYESMLENNNIAILFDKVQKLTPEDLEQILRIVDTFNEETK